VPFLGILEGRVEERRSRRKGIMLGARAFTTWISRDFLILSSKLLSALIRRLRLSIVMLRSGAPASAEERRGGATV